MTFLNPFVLFGLVAAAIPIIIHLLNLRKLRTVEFSSLRFLKELQKTKMRRVRIRQLLLLALRTLLIVAIVLAFSRPALRTSLAGLAGGHAATTMVILLDDSPSMTVRDERGVLFNQARDAAAQLASLAKEGDHLFVLRLSDLRHTSTFVPLRTAAASSAALSAMTPAEETVPFREALRAAARITAASSNANEEVFLITDAQATQFRPDTLAGDSAAGFDPRVKFFLVRTGSREPDNAGIASARVTTQIITRNKPVQIQARVHNAGASPMHGSMMSVYLDGTRVVQQALDVPAQSTVTADATFMPKRRGILKGYVQIEDDALEADNRRFFVLHVPEHINILLAGGTPADAKLPSLALTLAGDTTIADLFSVRQITEGQLPSMDLNAYDVIVLSNIRNFSPALSERMHRFVRAGGGLMIFPGAQANIQNYNETLFASLGIPPAAPAPFLPASQAAAQGQRSFVSFQKTDLAHPLFSGMFEQAIGRRRDAGIESPHVFAAIAPRPGPRGSAIITLSNGDPFLVEYPSGNGRVLLCAVEAGLTWSDFPVTGLFAPLLYRSMIYLAVTNQSVPSLTVGQPVNLPVRLKTYGERDVYSLRSPSGVDEKVVPKILPASTTALFESTRSGESGIYDLYRSSAGSAGATGQPMQAVAINIDPGETDLHREDEKGAREFLEKSGIASGQITQLSASQTLDRTVEESRYGVELWRHFLALALLLALAEMAVGREPKGAQQD